MYDLDTYHLKAVVHLHAEEGISLPIDGQCGSLTNNIQYLHQYVGGALAQDDPSRPCMCLTTQYKCQSNSFSHLQRLHDCCQQLGRSVCKDITIVVHPRFHRPLQARHKHRAALNHPDQTTTFSMLISPCLLTDFAVLVV